MTAGPAAARLLAVRLNQQLSPAELVGHLWWLAQRPQKNVGGVPTTTFVCGQVTFTVTWKAMITPHSMTPPGAAAFPGVVSGPQGRPNEETMAVPR
jgi:hypothetical protein